MILHEDSPELRDTIATACRVLAAKGLVDGLLGHVSARVSEDEVVVRCRGGEERGLGETEPSDIWRFKYDGEPVDAPDDYAPPNELPLHTELLRAKPEIGAVVHAHPRAALLCGLAGLTPRPIFGAYNIPAMRLAQDGIPVFDRPVLITRAELGREMVEAMGEKQACLLRGHGITVAAETVEQCTVLAVNFNDLLTVTVDLAYLGAHPPDVDERDMAELPDLGSDFNGRMAWQALVAEARAGSTA
jgi:ribulose-5-phosphate 4-epimerase/fuculose-1-phosphate aldolase